MPVAAHARVGSQPLFVAGYKVRDHTRLKFVGKRKHVKRHSQPISYIAGIRNGGRGAAGISGIVQQLF